MSNDANIPWWEIPGAPGENRTKEQHDAMMRAAKEPNPNRRTRLHGAANVFHELWQSAERERGALVIVLGEDCEASIDGWLGWYRQSGLMRRKL